MGLDMFLSKMTDVNQYNQEGADINSTSSEWKGIQFKRIKGILEEVGYWRKANAIHKWIVKVVQKGQDDCKEYVMNEEQMRKLLQLCEMVIKNKKFAHKLLPTETGFFWGETEYDDYYYEQIDYTAKLMKECLSSPGTYYYQSSW